MGNQIGWYFLTYRESREGNPRVLQAAAIADVACGCRGEETGPRSSHAAAVEGSCCYLPRPCPHGAASDCVERHAGWRGVGLDALLLQCESAPCPIGARPDKRRLRDSSSAVGLGGDMSFAARSNASASSKEQASAGALALKPRDDQILCTVHTSASTVIIAEHGSTIQRRYQSW